MPKRSRGCIPSARAGVLLLDSSAERDPWAVIPRGLRIDAAYVLASVLSRTGLQKILGTTVRRILNQSIPPDGIPIETYDWIEQIYRTPSYLQASLIEDFVYPGHGCGVEHDQASNIHAGCRGYRGRCTHRPRDTVGASVARETTAARELSRTPNSPWSETPHHHAMIDQPTEVAGLITELVSQSQWRRHVTCPLEPVAQDPNRSSAMAR